jgi:hypothetical protein
MRNNHQENLEKFINFCQENITGQERKEAQIFLDRFFQAFGYDGALETGAKYEEAIKKGSLKIASNSHFRKVRCLFLL